MVYGPKNGGGTQVVHKWSPSGISISGAKYLTVGWLLYLGLYSRSEQADNEFYRVRGYMSCNRVAVSSVGIQQSDLPGCGRSDYTDSLASMRKKLGVWGGYCFSKAKSCKQRHARSQFLLYPCVCDSSTLFQKDSRSMMLSSSFFIEKISSNRPED